MLDSQPPPAQEGSSAKASATAATAKAAGSKAELDAVAAAKIPANRPPPKVEPMRHSLSEEELKKRRADVAAMHKSVTAPKDVAVDSAMTAAVNAMRFPTHDGKVKTMEDFDTLSITWNTKCKLGLKAKPATAAGLGGQLTAIDKELPTEHKLVEFSKFYSVNGEVVVNWEYKKILSSLKNATYPLTVVFLTPHHSPETGDISRMSVHEDVGPCSVSGHH